VSIGENQSNQELRTGDGVSKKPTWFS